MLQPENMVSKRLRNTKSQTLAYAAPQYTNLLEAFPYLEQNMMLAHVLCQGLVDVEHKLYRTIEHPDPLLDSTSRHLAEAGGKRLRPLLALLAAQLGDGTTQQVLIAATVAELTHLATLYHDDVMDSAPLRRGTRTVHEVWGNSVAILTGDFLLARASKLGIELGTEALNIHADTFERLCLGQISETVGPKNDEDPLEHYISVIRDKTGSLVAASAHLGALAAKAPASVIKQIVEYGEKVGVAFQLADDIIDINGNGSGKIAGTDLREGVATLPVLLARQAAHDGDAQAQETIKLIDSDLGADEDLAKAVKALRSSPVMQQARALVERWSQEAIDAIEPLERNEIKDALIAFATELATRHA